MTATEQALSIIKLIEEIHPIPKKNLLKQKLYRSILKVLEVEDK